MEPRAVLLLFRGEIFRWGLDANGAAVQRRAVLSAYKRLARPLLEANFTVETLVTYHYRVPQEAGGCISHDDGVRLLRAWHGPNTALAHAPARTQSHSVRLAFDAFLGPAALVRHTYAAEGTRAFFQGVTPRLATYSGVKASLFALFEAFREKTGSVALAGAAAGGRNTAISCPQDVLKSRLQVQVASGPGHYLGPLATAKLLLEARGVAAFYAGWLPLVCRDVPGYALLYSVYVAGTERRLPTALVGAASGLAFYVSTLPVDRVKTVMMTQPLDRPAFSSARAAFLEIYAANGILGFYRGCGPTLARTACGQAVALSVYDWASRRAR